jgi:ubiquinone/menaquinone biosynthesis C-methylase UbiE
MFDNHMYRDCWTIYELREVFKYLEYNNAEADLQLQHRMAIIHMWAPVLGTHVIEVGCGQGETTIVLAAAVGASGHVLAVDNGPAEYGRPVTLGEAHTYIKAATLGDCIEFLLSTDLLDPQIDFPENAFDLAVFSHSSWYMSSPQELQQLFARVRLWARRLGYAEWDVRPRHLQQLPHLLAVLLQAHAHSVAPQTSTANVRSLILPEHARLLAENAGWTITEEKIIDTSTPLGYGKAWEIHKALEMAEALTASDDVAEEVRSLLTAEKRLLSRIAHESRNLSLSTYAFLAE